MESIPTQIPPYRSYYALETEHLMSFANYSLWSSISKLSVPLKNAIMLVTPVWKARGWDGGTNYNNHHHIINDIASLFIERRDERCVTHTVDFPTNAKCIFYQLTNLHMSACQSLYTYLSGGCLTFLLNQPSQSFAILCFSNPIACRFA